ncbi:unnamed protein product [Linum trigynum]|uniref:Uncharacterized protein n=1 Tax=Linum trigynum TaxID=586398 RepID=A0AAV2FS15_9ROSI
MESLEAISTKRFKQEIALREEMRKNFAALIKRFDQFLARRQGDGKLHREIGRSISMENKLVERQVATSKFKFVKDKLKCDQASSRPSPGPPKMSVEQPTHQRQPPCHWRACHTHRPPPWLLSKLRRCMKQACCRSSPRIASPLYKTSKRMKPLAKALLASSLTQKKKRAQVTFGTRASRSYDNGHSNGPHRSLASARCARDRKLQAGDAGEFCGSHRKIRSILDQ